MDRVILSVEINVSQFPFFMFDQVQLISLYFTPPSFCSPSHHSAFFPFSLSPSPSFFFFLSLPFSLSSFLPLILLFLLLLTGSAVISEAEDESGRTCCDIFSSAQSKLFYKSHRTTWRCILRKSRPQQYSKVIIQQQWKDCY